MTILSASALDLDPAGCALLKATITRNVPRPAAWVWVRASAGFVASTGFTVVVLVALAAL
jgi:hypothetical protein